MWPFTATYPEAHIEDVDGLTFDYIIVGGGTAGCVLASRLSEDASVSVLLLEKGRVRDHILSRIPLWSQNFFFPGLQAVKDRFSEPIAACHGKRAQLWGAEALGGGTRINALLVTRGPPGGYAAWADMGLTDWGWDKVEPYFRRMENARGHLDKEYRGHDGPLESAQFPQPFKFYSYLEKACLAVGLPIEQDCNFPSAPAQGYFHLDIAVDQRGQRLSTYRAYLGKHVALERRGRLTVCTGVVASKLQLDETTRQVTGVHVVPVRPGKSARDFFVKARREVVVCNGAFRTPQLLMLSGIGPRDKLAAQGIPCIHELPAVGENLYDHYSVPIMMEMPCQETLHKLTNALYAVWSLLLYFLFGTGLFGAPSTASSIFVRTSSLDEKAMAVRTRAPDKTENTGSLLDTMDASQPRNIPDVEIMINPVNCTNVAVPGRSFLTLYATIVQPYSKGRIELASRDPLAHPKVYYPMFTDPRDWALMRAATRFTMKLAEEFEQSGYPYRAPLVFAPGMNVKELELFMQAGPDPSPSPPAKGIPPVQKPSPSQIRNLKLEPVAQTWQTATDEEIDEFARRVANTSLHFSCTCRMSLGPEDGVVDQRLRVHGLRNLRIVDASVLPRIPSAHTMAPIIMMAERCADFLREEWMERKTK